jgi:hypothetical protein
MRHHRREIIRRQRIFALGETPTGQALVFTHKQL